MQWIVPDASTETDSRSLADARSTSPTLTPIRVTADVSAFAAKLDDAEAEENAAGAAGDAPGSAAFGQYVGQINARIDRAWLRPRSPIGDDRFTCEVRIQQEATGKVTEVVLERCNGTARWRLSLVHAIESASPLPVPADPAVFTRAIHMSFTAPPAEDAASLEQYEPANTP